MQTERLILVYLFWTACTVASLGGKDAIKGLDFLRTRTAPQDCDVAANGTSEMSFSSLDRSPDLLKKNRSKPGAEL